MSLKQRFNTLFDKIDTYIKDTPERRERKFQKRMARDERRRGKDEMKLTKETKDDLIMRSCFIGMCLIVGVLLLDIILSPIFMMVFIFIAMILGGIPFFRLRNDIIKNKPLGG